MKSDRVCVRACVCVCVCVSFVVSRVCVCVCVLLCLCFSHSHARAMSYAGDDVSAVCGDLGSDRFRCGYAGTDMPGFVFRAHVGYGTTSSSPSKKSNKRSATPSKNS